MIVFYLYRIGTTVAWMLILVSAISGYRRGGLASVGVQALGVGIGMLFVLASWLPELGVWVRAPGWWLEVEQLGITTSLVLFACGYWGERRGAPSRHGGA